MVGAAERWYTLSMRLSARPSQSGFSLLELAIVLVVIGLMTTVFVTAGGGTQASECNTKTTEQLRQIQRYVQGYVASNGRLPRPALVTLGSSQGEFGKEVASLPNADLVDTGTVLIGSLPHVTLGLPQEFGSDCWGKKFTYAVTKSLTSSDPATGYTPSAGGIIMRTGTRAAPQDLMTNGSYIVISHGPDQVGGTPLSAADSTPRWCNLADGTEIDRENCDASNNVFFDGFPNKGDVAANNFDDLIIFESKTAPPGAPPSTTYAWGANGAGNLGDGTTTTRLVPTTVVGGISFVQVTGGDAHSCGITASGAAYCWGVNTEGRLGDGTTTTRLTPTAVVGGLSFVQISAGKNHTCGVTTSGEGYCWGRRTVTRSADDTSTPFLTGGALTFTKISAGGSGHACGITTTGTAYCWGINSYGAIGDGTTNTATSPTLVSGGLTFTNIETDYYQSCGLTAGGAAYCWGINDKGQLGTNDTTNQLVPTAVQGGIAFSELAVGSVHVCGLDFSGAAYCWGSNLSGRLGDGTTTNRLTPVPVSGGLTFTQINAGGSHNCGLTASGVAHCWGRGGEGQIGNNTTTSTNNTPKAVSGGLTFAQIATGYDHNVAIQGAPPCKADGQPPAGGTCCNADTDANGQCGVQGAPPPSPCFNIVEAYFAYQADCLGPHETVTMSCPSGTGSPTEELGSPTDMLVCGRMPTQSDIDPECTCSL